MRRVLFILAIATLVSLAVDVMSAPRTPVATMTAKSKYENGISVHGLHIAIPEGMKNFPAELVPLP
jgi:hypothetical protein